MNLEQLYNYRKKGLVSLRPGYLAYNGHVFTKNQCANYNNQVNNILSNNVTDRTIDHFLDYLNQTFKIAIGVF